MRAHWFQHVAFEGLGAIEPWLQATASVITVTRFHDDPALPDVDAVDLLIVMGGPMSVNDEARYPWLREERRFIRQAIERGTRVLGVCLGAQLIAQAMGARVYPNQEREIGWFPITGLSPERDAPAWAKADARTTVFHWHGDTFDLPDGATQLARSAGCEQQAFRIGSHVVGIQFHLETTAALTQQMAAHGRDELAPSRFVQPESELLATPRDRFTALTAAMTDTLDRLTSVARAT